MFYVMKFESENQEILNKLNDNKCKLWEIFIVDGKWIYHRKVGFKTQSNIGWFAEVETQSSQFFINWLESFIYLI